MEIRISEDITIVYDIKNNNVFIEDNYSDELGQVWIDDKSSLQAIIDALIKIKAEMDKQHDNT